MNTGGRGMMYPPAPVAVSQSQQPVVATTGAPRPITMQKALMQRQQQPPPPPRPQAYLLRLNCMYTKQVNKKRKVWSDGVLKVAIEGESIRVTLVNPDDPRQIPLDGRQLEPGEVQLFKNRSPHEIQLENYIVDVTFEDQTGATANTTTSAAKKPPLKIGKFVPPSRYVPPTASVDNTSNTNTNTNTARYPPSSSSATAARSYGSSSRTSYQITDSELDDIWGAKPSQPTSSNLSTNSLHEEDEFGAQKTPQHQSGYGRSNTHAIPYEQQAPNRSNQPTEFHQLQSSNRGLKLVQTSLQPSRVPVPNYQQNAAKVQPPPPPQHSSSFLQDDQHVTGWDDFEQTHQADPKPQQASSAISVHTNIASKKTLTAPLPTATDDWGDGWGEFGDTNYASNTSVAQNTVKTASAVSTSFDIDDSIWFN